MYVSEMTEPISTKFGYTWYVYDIKFRKNYCGDETLNFDV